MLEEFIFEHKVYALRKEVNSDATSEVVVLFKQLDRAQAFFRSILTDRFACEDLMSAAKWLGITNLDFPKQTCPQDAQSILEQLSLKIWAGDLFLVEIRPVQKIEWDKCCLDAIKAIKQIFKAGKWLSRSLLPAKLAMVLLYPPGKPAIASAASTAVNLAGVNPADINAKEWEVLARAIIGVPEIVRDQVYNIAESEAFKHQSKNEQVLYHFWKGVCDVFK